MNNALIAFDSKIQKYKPFLDKLLVGTKYTPDTFIATAQNLIRRDKKLLSVDQSSLFGAMMKAAELGLSIADFRGECYILPYAGMAQFQIGYQGFITLMYQAGVTYIQSAVVYENDEFDFQMGLSPVLAHRPARSNRGEPIGTYAIAKLNGDQVFKYLSKEDIERFMSLSQAANGRGAKYSPWKSDRDPENWMWQKTVIKQLAKVLPKTPRLSSAIYADDIAETGGSIKIEKDQVVVVDTNMNRNLAKAENDEAEDVIFNS